MRFIKVKQFTAKLAEGIAKYDFEDDEIRTYICMAVVKLDDHIPTWDTEAMAKGQPWENGSYYHEELWGEEDGDD